MKPLKSLLTLHDLPGAFIFVREVTRQHVEVMSADHDVSDPKSYDHFIVRIDRIATHTEEPA